mmetsp:Transcript_16327/g.22076  ORF Transcript_16327/g.22076 Transcript_16327/m.22076 type:complete len:91 (+) Transcript_16327:858-1130(+)
MVDDAKENDNPLAFKLTFSPATEQKNHEKMMSASAFAQVVPPFRIRPRGESASKRIGGQGRKYDTIVPEREARLHAEAANDIAENLTQQN